MWWNRLDGRGKIFKLACGLIAHKPVLEISSPSQETLPAGRRRSLLWGRNTGRNHPAHHDLCSTFFAETIFDQKINDHAWGKLADTVRMSGAK